MLKKFLKKTLAVVMTSAVIASASAVSLPVFAAESSITQSYSIVNYDSDREFAPRRYGDIQAYSRGPLGIYFGSTNRIPTGIWSTPGAKLKVYVQADSNDPLPKLVFTQHLTDGTAEKVVTLTNGINEITSPTVVSSVESGFETGGSVYILNPLQRITAKFQCQSLYRRR